MELSHDGPVKNLDRLFCVKEREIFCILEEYLKMVSRSFFTRRRAPERKAHFELTVVRPAIAILNHDLALEDLARHCQFQAFACLYIRRPNISRDFCHLRERNYLGAYPWVQSRADELKQALRVYLYSPSGGRTSASISVKEHGRTRQHACAYDCRLGFQSIIDNAP
jgi:hypothetical protein